MRVDINPYDRSVTIDGVKVKEKINPFPDKLNHLSTISCDYDAALNIITDVHNIHRYVSHFIAREYYYEHLKEFVDWYYLEQEAQLLKGDSEGFGKIVVNDVTLDAEVHGDALYLNAGEGIEITAEKEEVSQAKVIRVTEKYIDVAYAESLTNISDKLRVGGLAVITNEEGTTFFHKKDDVTFKELEVKGTGGESILPADFLIDFEKMKNRVTELGVISGEHTEQLEELEAKPVAEVGSIIYSLLPIDSVTHHLLDGTLINGTGIYANFYEHVSKVFDSGKHPSLFIEEDEWQESITTYGVCGKFVLNQVNKTIRLPKITGFIEGTLDSTALGNLVEAGLPNIEGRSIFSTTYGVRWSSAHSEGTGAISLQDAVESGGSAGQLYQGISSSSGTISGFKLNASQFNPIYGNSDTVQPQSIKGYIYMIVATGISATVEVSLKDVEKALFDLEKKVEEIGDNDSEIDKLDAKVNNKANISLDNISKEALEAIAYAAMPSEQYIDLTLPTSGGVVVAPADGYVVFWAVSTKASHAISLENNSLITISQGNTAGIGQAVFIPAGKNDNITVVYANITVTRFRFVYANGSIPA